MAETETNNWNEDVRKLVRVRAGLKAFFSKYENRTDDLVADHAVTSEKLSGAEALLSTLQNKYKTILRCDVEIELKIEDDTKLSEEQEVSSDYETRMNTAIARLSDQINNIKTHLKAGITAAASTSLRPSTKKPPGRMRLPKLKIHWRLHQLAIL